MALEDASTTKKGIVQLSSATNSTSESLAATPKAVKAAYDLANGKYTAQDATTAQKGIIQLSSATNSTSETLAATPKAVKAANDNAEKRLQKDQNGADIPGKDTFTKNIGACRAFGGSVSTTTGNWTTAQFIEWLDSQGAFNHPYWMCKGSWSYGNNKIITDTGCGNIHLAGAVIEVMGIKSAMTIRITTPTTSTGGGTTNAQFTYINHGTDYSPGWRRDYNSRNKPTASEIGALPSGGTAVSSVNLSSKGRVMAFRMSEQPRTIKIYNLLAGTNEFIGEGDAYIPPHTGLPANSTDIAPPDIPAGFVAVFNSDESSWHLVEDHRGKTVYDVASGNALFISELGPLPENVTWLSPEGEFQKWNGTAWVKDTEAEKLFRIREAEETKNNLMQVASEHIAPLQDAADLEIATEEEISLLEAWKKYRVLLNRVDTSTAQDIEWPALP